MPGTKATAKQVELQSRMSELLMMGHMTFSPFSDREQAKQDRAKWKAKIDAVKAQIEELNRNDPYLKGMSWIPQAM